jgi:hypothetical protein
MSVKIGALLHLDVIKLFVRRSTQTGITAFIVVAVSGH